MSSTPKPNRSWLSAEAPLAQRIRGCTRCPALVRCRKAPVPGAGPGDARLMIVGIAPGRLGADRTGVPFYGDRSGKRLRDALGAAVLGVYITNAVKCAPKACGAVSDASGLRPRYHAREGGCLVEGGACRPRNRDPVPDEVRNCAPYLREEVATIRPQGIVVLGAWPKRRWTRLSDRRRSAVWRAGRPARSRLLSTCRIRPRSITMRGGIGTLTPS